MFFFIDNQHIWKTELYVNVEKYTTYRAVYTDSKEKIK